MTITEFLLARVAEDEEARLPFWHLVDCPITTDVAAECSCGSRARILADCESKRRIIEWHQSWPVLVETEPVFEQADPTDVNSMTFRMSKQIAWATEQKYREHFGTEPPTGPIIRFMVQPYADHPDFDPAWSLSDA